MADCLFGSRDAVRSAEEHSVNLKAMTANAISGALWRNFQGNAVAGSEVEYYEARLSPALLAEVFYRKVPRLNRLFAIAAPSNERHCLLAWTTRYVHSGRW